jgi:hypothetical protein
VEFLPELLPIVENLLESLYQCQRGLVQRGWDEKKFWLVVKVRQRNFRNFWVATHRMAVWMGNSK